MCLEIQRKRISVQVTREGPSEEKRFAGCLETFLIRRYLPLFSDLDWRVETASAQKGSPGLNARHAALVTTDSGHRERWLRPQAAVPMGHRGSQATSHHSGSLCKGTSGREKQGDRLYFKVGLCSRCQFRTVKCVDPRLLIAQWAIFLFHLEPFNSSAP